MNNDTNLFRTIFDHSNTGIVILQPDDPSLKNCNRAFSQMIGYSLEELKEKNLEDLSHREDWASEKRDYISICNGEIDSSQCEKRFINKGGEAIWTHVVTTSSKNEQGAVLHIVQFVQDISSHKKSLDKIEQQEHFVRNVIDAVPNLITVKDHEGKYTLVNLAAAEFYGRTVDEMEGVTDDDLGPQAGDPEKIHREDLEILDSLQDKFVLEQTVRDVTGHSRVWQTYRRPIYVETGEAYQVLNIATDVTEFKKLARSIEEQDKKLQQERSLLEERVKHRTAEFDVKMDESNKLIQTYRRLLSILNHEVRSNLTAILGMADVLQQGGQLNPSQLQCVELIHDGGRMLSDLIGNMLELIKLETDQQPLKKENISVEEIKTFFHQAMGTKTQKKVIRTSWKCDPAVMALNASKPHLKQILQNLLPSVAQVAPANSEITFEIKGDKFCKVADIVILASFSEMPAEDFARLMQDAELQEESISQERGVSKLALTLASRLAKLHNGAIRIDTEQKQGLKVVVSLPWSP